MARAARSECALTTVSSSARSGGRVMEVCQGWRASTAPRAGILLRFPRSSFRVELRFALTITASISSSGVANWLIEHQLFHVVAGGAGSSLADSESRSPSFRCLQKAHLRILPRN